VRSVLDQNERQVGAYRSGKPALLGFFVGQVMKQTGGSAAPDVVNAVLRRLLDPADGPLTAAPLLIAPPSVSEQLPTLVPRKLKSSPVASDKPSTGMTSSDDRKTLPLPATPVVVATPETDEDLDPSPMAHSVAPAAPTLTSAAGMMLPLMMSQLEQTPPSESLPELADCVSQDDFARIDLRVGVIVAAARVPGEADLLDLHVNTGDAEGPRRIFAEFALSFTPDALVGWKVIVAVNLEPRSLAKGLVSHGAILSAGLPSALALAVVSRDVPPGTKVG
jgi:methionine--tRNA ligase beta chain